MISRYLNMVKSYPMLLEPPIWGNVWEFILQDKIPKQPKFSKWNKRLSELRYREVV